MLGLGGTLTKAATILSRSVRVDNADAQSAKPLGYVVENPGGNQPGLQELMDNPIGG